MLVNNENQHHSYMAERAVDMTGTETLNCNTAPLRQCAVYAI